MGLRGWVGGDQRECLVVRPWCGHMFVFNMVVMVHMFMFRKRSRQYLHMSQGEHLLRLLEGNLHDAVIIVWWRWRRWRLVVSRHYRHCLVVTRIILSVVSWWRLWKQT